MISEGSVVPVRSCWAGLRVGIFVLLCFSKMRMMMFCKSYEHKYFYSYSQDTTLMRLG